MIETVELTTEPVGRSVSVALSSKTGKVVVCVLVFFWTIPTFGLLVSSVRPEKEVKTTGWWTAFLRPKFTLSNYSKVWNSAAGSGDGLGHYFLNSFKIAIPSTVIPISIAALAAYAFSWMRFKGRDWLYIGVICLLAVPLQMALIPVLQLNTHGAHIGSIPIIPALGLQDSIVLVWMAHTFFGMPFAIFILRNFISALPSELIEAARVDGAGHLTVFRKLVLPLSIPAIASLAIFQFMWVWNDLLIGRLFGGSKNLPIIGKLVELAGTRGQDWHLLTAGAFVAMAVPLVVFFSLQRFFVRGLLAGAVKG